MRPIKISAGIGKYNKRHTIKIEQNGNSRLENKLNQIKF